MPEHEVPGPRGEEAVIIGTWLAARRHTITNQKIPTGVTQGSQTTVLVGFLARGYASRQTTPKRQSLRDGLKAFNSIVTFEASSTCSWKADNEKTLPRLAVMSVAKVRTGNRPNRGWENAERKRRLAKSAMQVFREYLMAFGEREFLPNNLGLQIYWLEKGNNHPWAEIWILSQ